MTETDFVDMYISETTQALAAFQADVAAHAALQGMADDIASSLRQGGKMLVAGNGGSAGDAQHIAGEFISRLMFDRQALSAMALTTDTSVITAIGNDYGYEHVFERQVVGLGRTGDVFLGISTSGTSTNIIRALEAARDKGLICHAFGGMQKAPMDPLCDRIFKAASTKTAIVQQIHIVAAHILCALVERAMFPQHAT